MKERIENLKREHETIPIPACLDEVVNEAISKVPRRKKRYPRIIGLSAAAILLLVVGINLSPALAKGLSDIPGFDKLIDVVTINKTTEKELVNLEMQTPEITGMENKTLQHNLNKKYIEESKQLYHDFKSTMEELEESHRYVEQGYEILTNDAIILSLRRYTFEIQASSSYESKIDTIDKEFEVVLTLQSLFKDKQYVTVLSDYIKKEMRRQMIENEEIIYWVNTDEPVYFDKIKEDQNFYINPDYKLVITFDKYEVAPGYMGPVEFEIPTGIIKDILVGDRYIKE